MVKRRTQYVINCSSADNFNYQSLLPRTSKQAAKAIRLLTLDWEPNSCLNYELIVKKNSKKVNFLQQEFETIERLKPLIEARSISKIWHRWNQLLGSIIPEGFQVLTNKYDPIPTALSIRQRLKSLIPTAYNCYLLDRDIRRYLGLELRHD